MRFVATMLDVPGVFGTWDVSTAARRDILRCLVWAEDMLRKVCPERCSFGLAISTAHLRAVSCCQEVVDHVADLVANGRTVRLVNGIPDLSWLYGFQVLRCAACRHPELIGYSFESGRVWSVQFVDFVSAGEPAGPGPIPVSREVQDGSEENRPEGGQEREEVSEKGQQGEGQAGSSDGLGSR